ncbi:MAG TPA: EscU/YscU/HrcU family type III secretion system export apparatus switch protein, partial [Gemmatimonadales bacterium]|nr:EscU/YscU/HrcU family type III secretion system export apparatus switch protein [Gemmatimonadales bacterium]
IAREAGVPIVRNVPVARALLAGARVGQPIPPALYAAVAEVLAFVYRVRGRLPQHLAEARRA